MFNRRSLTTLALSGVLAFGTAGAAQAKHGSDDPPGDDHGQHHEAGDDHGRHHGRHRSDDGKRHHKGRHGSGHRRHGNDDGPNHT
jgi:hypothetical protein